MATQLVPRALAPGGAVPALGKTKPVVAKSRNTHASGAFTLMSGAAHKLHQTTGGSPFGSQRGKSNPDVTQHQGHPLSPHAPPLVNHLHGNMPTPTPTPKQSLDPEFVLAEATKFLRTHPSSDRNYKKIEELTQKLDKAMTEPGKLGKDGNARDTQKEVQALAQKVASAMNSKPIGRTGSVASMSVKPAPPMQKSSASMVPNQPGMHPLGANMETGASHHQTPGPGAINRRGGPHHSSVNSGLGDDTGPGGGLGGGDHMSYKQGPRSGGVSHAMGGGSDYDSDKDDIPPGGGRGHGLGGGARLPSPRRHGGHHGELGGAGGGHGSDSAEVARIVELMMKVIKAVQKGGNIGLAEAARGQIMRQYAAAARLREGTGPATP